jgi:signal transduction histidine kinase
VSRVPFERLWRRLDPRRSVAARLLVGFCLAFLLPGGVFLFLIQRRLTDLQRASSNQIAGVRVAEAAARMERDVHFRAEAVEREARTAEEDAWSLAAVAQMALSGRLPAGPGVSRLSADAAGHEWTPQPDDDSIALVSGRSADPSAARDDARRLGVLTPLMRGLRQRRPTIRTVSIWTASGAMRQSPWFDLYARMRKPGGGQLARFLFSDLPRFPEARPATGDAAVWMASEAGRSPAGAARLSQLFVPVRNEAGAPVAIVALEVDVRRYMAEEFESWEPAGDFWFATDRTGRAVLMTPRAAAVLGWNGLTGTRLAEGPSPELRRLSSAGLGKPTTMDEYLIDGRRSRIASARIDGTGWVLFEGLSNQVIDTIRGEALRAFPPSSYSALKRDVTLLFLLLLPAVLVLVGIVSRRISAPVEELVRAAEEIGRGRPVRIGAGAAEDELGRLAVSIDTMATRVARRVETLRRLHQFARSAYRMTDFREVVGRSTQAIAAFTNAERVWLQLYDSNTRRLEVAIPSWNVPEEMAAALRISVDSRSIAGMVFRTGEAYCSNDLAHDAYASRELLASTGARNGVFAPLKTEEETLGVVVAIGRPQGFGQEEIDAVTSFADLASLLIRNARLYATLTGTVDELKRASRLKDHFLQNVNHELRTPLTAIVGWTDLFEEGGVDEPTLRRGLTQVRQSARLLLALIDDLLDLARLDRGTLTLDRRPVFLSEVIQRSLDTVRLMAEARGVVLILAPLPEPMPPIRADALRLQQVLWNLLANAIQFSPRLGRVVVRVEREPERYLVSVEDDGIGIPESELPHVFERFRQVDGSATRGHAGMGIGLALARSLVELHGGSIWASSVVGQGSRFTLALPIRGPERRTVETEALAPMEEGAGTQTGG